MDTEIRRGRFSRVAGHRAVVCVCTMALRFLGVGCAGMAALTLLGGCAGDRAKVVIEAERPDDGVGESDGDLLQSSQDAETEEPPKIPAGDSRLTQTAQDEQAVLPTASVETSAALLQICVHICGQVQNPGVYDLAEGSRVWDAVQAAGGFTGEAAADAVNLALMLSDGAKITIPSLAEVSAAASSDAFDSASGEAAHGGTRAPEDWYESGDTVQSQASAAQTAQDGLVNINQADVNGLTALPGIGEVRARAIVEYREKYGPFGAIEDIMRVTGIKEGLFARIRDYITVGG